jgi:hypothetical protein
VHVSRLKALCIDCADPWTLAHWWADVLGYSVRPHTDDDVAWLHDHGFERIEDDPAIALDPRDGVGPTVWFNKVPEPKTVKDRIHLDVYGDVDALVAHGATVAETLDDWTILRDPEGNEFCAFPPKLA